MKKLKTLLTTTFKGFSGKKFNPRRYLEMADIELEHDREGVHYRLADRVDIVALLAIERDVYNGDIPWTFSHFEHEIVKNDEAFFIVAEISGSVIGFIGTRINHHGQDAHITNLAVFKAFQGQQIASTLIEQLIVLMSALGKNEMTLEVRRDNTKAQGLYRRQGFVTDKLLPEYYEDGDPFG
ncbi:N-alpha-acetyltransferase RimI [Lactococcus lactis]|nr:N-alpha-acetyltransferase RimI [Lactococcus lactis]